MVGERGIDSGAYTGGGLFYRMGRIDLNVDQNVILQRSTPQFNAQLGHGRADSGSLSDFKLM